MRSEKDVKRAWRNMWQRCVNPSYNGYAKYGGRGIKVCSRWESFELFQFDMGPKPLGTSLDRIDNNGDYTPSNCRWSDRRTQQRNTSRNRWLIFNGARLTVADWEERLGINRKTITKRLQLGWSTESALTTPVKKAV